MRSPLARSGWLVIALSLLSAEARAEWQVKPFLGVTFGGGTTLVGDLEHAVGTRKPTLGVSAALLGEVLGLEIDVAHSPGFFDGGGPSLISKSRVTTASGNVMVALPRRMAEYSLRPYMVAGAGVLRARTTTFANVLELRRTLAAVDIGAGVTGFVSPGLGLSWDVRHFRHVGGDKGPAGSLIGDVEQFSFWRANMALAFRY